MTQLPEMVRALLKPETYPERPSSIELAQTQMSFVFLGDEFVYKIKKPVNFGFLDYTTLEKRLFYCQKEIELNRRLCPNAYLGVVSIAKDGGGFHVGTTGEAVEYAVKMRRLPVDAMMDALLIGNKVSPQMISRVAERLADFHKGAETNADINRFGNLETIVQNTEENFTQTQQYIGVTLSETRYRHINEYTRAFINERHSLFHKRITRGRIRDCHGDLHAAHICFTNDICIYDCIEFNDRFRYCDVASEVAFLAMDLDRYGRPELSRSFVNAYVARSQDKDLLSLLHFYKCYRAYVRGKVESFKLDDPHISRKEKDKVLVVAKKYFELAESYISS